MKRYRTIVVDPPWSYPEGWPVGSEGDQVSPYAARRGIPYERNRRTPLRYEQMSVAEIAVLPVGDLADRDAHLYLWTTNRYLFDAKSIAESWGFRYSQLIVWAKTPMGIGPGGIWAQTTEYVLFCRRGSLRGKRRFDTCWFGWKRMGKAHSRKPDAFLDMVEQASPGPYVELFARRARFGWDYWGNESLGTVNMPQPTPLAEAQSASVPASTPVLQAPSGQRAASQTQAHVPEAGEEPTHA